MDTVIDTLITDREDRASYGYLDLNRVGEAIVYVADRLNASGYPVTVSPRIDWSRTNRPTLTALSTLRGQVGTLRSILPMPGTSPATPENHNWMSIDDANALEKILLDIDALITNIELCWMQSGEIFSGEV